MVLFLLFILATLIGVVIYLFVFKKKKPMLLQKIEKPNLSVQPSAPQKSPTPPIFSTAPSIPPRPPAPSTPPPIPPPIPPQTLNNPPLP